MLCQCQSSEVKMGRSVDGHDVVLHNTMGYILPEEQQMHLIVPSLLPLVEIMKHADA